MDDGQIFLGARDMDLRANAMCASAWNQHYNLLPHMSVPDLTLAPARHGWWPSARARPGAADASGQLMAQRASGSPAGSRSTRSPKVLATNSGAFLLDETAAAGPGAVGEVLDLKVAEIKAQGSTTWRRTRSVLLARRPTVVPLRGGQIVEQARRSSDRRPARAVHPGFGANPANS